MSAQSPNKELVEKPKRTRLPKVEIFRNTLGTVVGISVNGQRMPFAKNVKIKMDAKNRVPRVTIEIYAQDIQFVETGSASMTPEPEKT
jgi:hypothetical protein